MRSRSPFTKYMIPAPSSQRKAGNIQSRMSFRVLPTKKTPKKNTQKTFSGTSKKIILENVSSLLVDSKVRICHDSRPLGIGNHLQRSKCPGHYIDLGVIKFDTKNAANLEAKRPLYHHPSYLSPLAYSLDCQRSSPKNVGHSTKARRIDFEK